MPSADSTGNITFRNVNAIFRTVIEKGDIRCLGPSLGKPCSVVSCFPLAGAHLGSLPNGMITAVTHANIHAFAIPARGQETFPAKVAPTVIEGTEPKFRRSQTCLDS